MAEWVQGGGGTLLALLAAVAAVAGAWLIGPVRRWLTALLLNGAAGVAALWLLAEFGGALGVRLGLNGLTLLVSALLGAPGTLAMALAGALVT